MNRIFRVCAVLVAIACGACASAGAEPGASYANAKREACRDADIVKREVMAMHKRQIKRRDTHSVLASAAARINARARSIGDDGWRLRDLAVSVHILDNTITERGDEGAASADVGAVRAELGCP